jgi:hypothetical protein
LVKNGDIVHAGLTNAYVNGSEAVGGLVGYSLNSHITSSYLIGNVSGHKYVGGLVGQINYGGVHYSHTEGYVTRGQSIGGLIGSAEDECLVNNSYSTSNIVTDSGTVGGLVGGFAGSLISNSYATGNVTGGGSSIGGFVGWLSHLGAVSNCYSSGDVFYNWEQAGGFVGLSLGTIINSYSTGNVVDTGGSDIRSVGGFVGDGSDSIIINCYSRGNVSVGAAEENTERLGGFAGQWDYGGSINNSYSTGKIFVTGEPSFVAGFIGFFYGDYMSNSYWDINTSERTVGCGAGWCDGVIGNTTEEMKTQSTFVDWDFEDIWRIDSELNDGHPHLYWLDTDLPVVHLFPIQDSECGFVSFNYSVSDDSDVVRCVLYIDGDKKETKTYDIDSWSENNSIGASVNSVGEHTAYVSCYDFYGNVNDSNEITFNLVDTVSPEVYLFSLENSTVTTRDFIFNVSDVSEIAKCSLYLDGVWKTDNISGVSKVNNNTISLSGISVGVHNSVISCEDQYGNIGNSSEVSFEVYESVPPVVNLFSLENSRETTRDFIFNVSDDSEISKCSLYLDDVLEAENSSEVSKINNNTISLSGISVGIHSSKISCEDQYGNIGNSSEVSFEVYESVPPEVYLFPRIDSESRFVNLTFNVSDGSGIANCTLYLDGNENKTETNIINLANNSFSLTFDQAGEHNASVFCYDIYGNKGDSDEISFTITDVPPVVYLFDVGDSTSTSRDFEFNVSDESDILKCSLYLDGVWKADNISEINKTDNNIINWVNLSIGRHNSFISCEDQYGNVGNSSRVSFEVREKFSGGGSIGPISSQVSESDLQNGYTRNLRKKDSLWFNHNEEKHLITINDMNENSVDITVQSEPQKFNIKVGESVNVDLNDDGVYDVEITYVEYLRTLASIKVRAISEEYKDSKVESDTKADSEAIVKDDGPGMIDERTVEEETKSNNWIRWIVAVVLIFVVVSFVLNRKGFFNGKRR